MNCPYPTARTCPLDPETGKFQSTVVEFAYSEQAAKLGITREQFRLIMQAHNFAEDKSKAEYAKFQASETVNIHGIECQKVSPETVKIMTDMDAEENSKERTGGLITPEQRYGTPPRVTPVNPDGECTDRNDPRLRQIKENGQQAAYLVLSAEERAKGFVRPVRRSYRHVVCGDVTTMSQAIAETYARKFDYYTGTMCVHCGTHFDLVKEVDGKMVPQFFWVDTPTEAVGS